MIRVSAFQWVPPFARGLVRDLRVRWALEEAGLPYQSDLIGPKDQESSAYRHRQPFGQVPAYSDEDVELFESGAIVLHIAERSDVLLPSDAAGRMRAIAWIFAALNSIEPHIQNLAAIDLFYANEEWAKLRRPGAVEMVEKRLDQLAAWLDGKEWLEESFTAGDLMMTSVLRIPRHTDLVADRPNLEAYRLRCEARPAFQRALAAQMGDFADDPPTG